MFNKIDNIKNRNSNENFKNLKEVVEYVSSKNRHEYNYILNARESGKKSKEYKEIKLKKIPCVIINFFHNKYINKDTILNPTGYMFFDIDNESDINNLNIDYTYVSAYWKSLSNTGYSIIVKVDGLNPNFLKESYTHVAKELKIDYDSSAVSKDRVTVLSYDPNAYYNDNAYSFNLHPFTNQKNTHYSVKKNILLGCELNGTKNSIRDNNFNEQLSRLNPSINYNKDGVFDLEKKLGYAELVIPSKKINEGSRERFLSTITHQLVSLNKDSSRRTLYNYIVTINKRKMNPPLEKKEVDIIFNKKYVIRYNLTPIENKTRRILFNPNLNFTISQKQSITMKTINKCKMKKSYNKIKTFLLNWNYKKLGKITILKTAKELGMNRKTISKYYSQIIKENNIVKFNTS